MILYENQLKDAELNIRKHRNHHKKKKGKNSTTYYCDDIFTFDIETTSAWIDNDNVIGYHKGETSDYWNSLEPLALPYIWQFSFNDTVYYGREFSDFLEVLDDINSRGITCIIWIHNLSFEFHFLSNILHWKSVFARAPHKPMKCVSIEYPNIEFRCSYMLTRLSLATWGEQIGLEKMVGDLDYEKIRTPLTPLSDIEMNYCKRDCLVVYKGIKEYIKKYNTQWNIPITQTGTVRRVVKELLTKEPQYIRKIKKLVPRDAAEYKILQQVFAGGYTHANRKYAGVVIHGYIDHYDFASSYPTVMVCEKYPMGQWLLCDNTIHEDKFDNYAFILHLKFKNITTKSYNTYIQNSKCISVKNILLDNGRILKADELEIIVSEQDYITIKNNYEWEDLEVITSYKSKKDYLPKEFIEYILELYENKTKLKDVEGKEEIYMQSKQYINSLFGMMVTAVVQANVNLLESGEWKVDRLTEELVNKKLFALKNKNIREKRYFLSYSWGCWVTAYARRNLWKCIESCDSEVVYCDTDSIFVIGKHDFSWYDEEVTDKLYKACKKLDIDFEKTRPSTPAGKKKPLGVFDREDACSEFITLGAKRYVERRISDNKLHLTVSGINKGAVELLNDDIYNFKDGFIFDKDAECVSKRLCTYIKDMPVVEYPDGYISYYKQGINLRRNGYKLSITDEYEKLLDLMAMQLKDIPEENLIKLKGFFMIGG